MASSDGRMYFETANLKKRIERCFNDFSVSFMIIILNLKKRIESENA